jgi:dTDP-4-dehydrorhamnose 3,5-epimerase
VKFSKTKLDGVLLITPPTIFEDFRGTYIETYNKELYNFAPEFVQDDFSISRENVLRGIHGDDKTWKLISCLWGEFYLVVVNWDESSSQFKQWDSFTLSCYDSQQVLIPPKFGNGHLVLSDAAIFHYKQSTYYDRDSQFTLKWNDPTLKIKWPIENPILSERDK